MANKPEGYEYSIAYRTDFDTIFEPFYIDRRGDLTAAELAVLEEDDFVDVEVLGYYVQPMSGGSTYGVRTKVN